MVDSFAGQSLFRVRRHQRVIMGLTLTLVIMFASLTVAGIANWLERRPHEVGSPPLVSYTAIQLVALVVALLMAAHLVSLVTGTPLESRFGF